MLFPRVHSNGRAPMLRPPSFPRAPRRAVVVMRPVETLPPQYGRLSVVCSSPSHPLPCSTVFAGFSNSEKGRRIAVYRCQLCGSTYAYCRDDATGRPRLLFSRPAAA